DRCSSPVTTTIDPPWLNPPDGACRMTETIRSIWSSGNGSGRNERCIRRRARTSRNSMQRAYIVGRMTRFQGKTALLTGGAKGIGAATAARFASEGATVVVADFDEEAANETARRIGGHAVRCDVTKLEDVDAAVAAAVDLHGNLDILVACAGVI